jgi:hypothetical protein
VKCGTSFFGQRTKNPDEPAYFWSDEMAGLAGPIAVGVEEEFHVVDVETRHLVPRAGVLLEQLPADRFTHELQRSVVEANSRPFVRLEDLGHDLTALRRTVIHAADDLGLGIVAAGSVPLVDLEALKISPTPATSRCSPTTSCSPASSSSAGPRCTPTSRTATWPSPSRTGWPPGCPRCSR